MTDLETLAQRVEAATGPDRKLDRDIVVELHRHIDQRNLTARKWAQQFWLRDDDDDMEPIRFTASLDAAMTLVPEGWLLDKLYDRRVDEGGRTPFQPPSGEYSARLYYFRRDENDVARRDNLSWGKGKSRALALCAAALRARNAEPKETGE